MMIRRKTLAWILLLLLTFSVSVHADTTELDLDQKGSVTVTISHTADNGGVIPIEQAGISLYYVASASIVNGQLTYVPTEGLEEYSDRLNSGFDASENREIASAINQYTGLSSLIVGTEQLTGTEGTVTFSDLAAGIYLAVQTTTVEGYYRISPFLVPIPMMNETGTGWTYDISAAPKTEQGNPDEYYPGDDENATTEEDEATTAADDSDDNSSESDSSSNDSTLPQTGMLKWPITVLAIGGVLFFSIGWVIDQRKKKKNG